MNPCPKDNIPISRASPQDWPVITLQQNVASTVKVQLVDSNYNNIDLSSATTEPNADGQPDDASNPDVTVITTGVGLSAGGSAVFYMVRHPTNPQTVSASGTFTSGGLCTFNFQPGATAMPGLFLGSILIYGTDGNLAIAKNCYVSVEQNTTDAFYRNGPLDITEVRLALRDYPEANTLLEDVEFSDKEIAHCIRKPVDWWNESLPPIGGFDYTAFPYRLNWLNGTIASLMKIAAHWYRRNKLSVSAAGIQVDYLDKAKDYQEIGDQMWKDYVDWCQQKKVSINIEGGWGHVPGRYAR